MENLAAVAIVVLALVVVVLVVVVVRRPRPADPVASGPVLDPEVLLAPIREQLRTVEQRVQQSQVDSTRSLTTLSGELRTIAQQNQHLFEQGQRLGEETVRISTALRGSGVAGDWGEMQLRRTVELAGLTEHVSFVEQVSITTEEGRLRPDLVVMLPERRNVVVDAKAPLVDFDGGSGDAAQATALRQHVVDLAKRDYAQHYDGTLDFVILFVPTEGILATALGHDPGLAEFAMGKRVLLATPMTLLAMLRAVQYGWSQISAVENAEQIVTDAIELHDRIAVFVEHFQRVGTGLRSAVDAYNKAAGSYQSRVQPQAARMRDHGLTVHKELGDPVALASDVREIGGS